MSPSVSTGPPHSRTTSVNGGGPVGTSTLRLNGLDGAKGSSRIYSHIDDLTSVRPDVDINSPIKKILNDAELLAKQADTHLDFRRPDIALQEYLKASILVAEIIPRHKDYPTLQSSQGDLHRGHTGLVKRIKAQDAKFDEVIKAIKDDNLRSGVRPSRKSVADLGLKGISRAGEGGHSRAMSVQTYSTSGSSSPSSATQDHKYGNGGSRPSDSSPSTSNDMQGKKKPPVQPKPDALHGKAIQTSSVSSTQPPQVDLAARFAKLRSLQPQNVTQDSRIRTQPISIPNSPQLTSSPSTAGSGKSIPTNRPFGTRELPSAPTAVLRSPKSVSDSQIPGMPKPPDPIYSPAGNTETTATINLPSSVSRNSSYLGKNNSAPPVSNVVQTPILSDSSRDYFSAAHKADPTPNGNRRPIPNIPSDIYITAQSLFEYLGMGSQKLLLLLVDLRDREEFDRGHIMAQNIICLEPITIRDGMSADELGESIVLSPDPEQKLYEKRDKFDLVVFYDHSSSSMNDSNYLERFSKALYDYGYEKKLKRRPMLLMGGLDAWVDLMGPGSLKSSSSSTTSSLKPARPLGRISIGSNIRRNPPRRQSRAFSKEEEMKWGETIKHDMVNEDNLAVEDPETDEFSYARTTEDFLRKYPELPSIQESMISTHPRTTIRNQYNEFDSPVPRPPTRPAPALPRQRSSGISERGPNATYAALSTPDPFTSSIPKAGLTGLQNFNAVTCYVNAIIQCLSQTPGVRKFLINEYHYIPDKLPPQKAGEFGPPPQLLTRNVANLLRVMWSGQYDWVAPKTFLAYVNAIYHKQLGRGQDPATGLCGLARQQDAQEFFAYIYDIMLDEVNMHRDQRPYETGNKSDAVDKVTVMEAAIMEWDRYKKSHSSALESVFTGMVLSAVDCTNCPYTNRQFNQYFSYTLVFPEAPPRITLNQLLDVSFNDFEEIPGTKCDDCGHQTGQTIRFSYLPDIQIFYFARFATNGSGRVSSKIKTHVDFDWDDVDLSRKHITYDPEVTSTPGSDPGLQAPPKYEAYAAVWHTGTQDSGHYVATARNLDSPKRAWCLFNDQLVGSGRANPPDLEKVGFTVALLFLKRKTQRP